MPEKSDREELRREIRQVLEELLREGVPQPIPWQGSIPPQLRLAVDLLPTLAAVSGKTPCVCVCPCRGYDVQDLNDRLEQVARDVGLSIPDLLAALERRTLASHMQQEVRAFLDRWEACGAEGGTRKKDPQ